MITGISNAQTASLKAAQRSLPLALGSSCRSMLLDMNTEQTARAVPIMIPGITPAMNSRSTDAPSAMLP